jgi:hypothetical protein
MAEQGDTEVALSTAECNILRSRHVNNVSFELRSFSIENMCAIDCVTNAVTNCVIRPKKRVWCALQESLACGTAFNEQSGGITPWWTSVQPATGNLLSRGTQYVINVHMPQRNQEANSNEIVKSIHQGVACILNTANRLNLSSCAIFDIPGGGDTGPGMLQRQQLLISKSAVLKGILAWVERARHQSITKIIIYELPERDLLHIYIKAWDGLESDALSSIIHSEVTEMDNFTETKLIESFIDSLRKHRLAYPSPKVFKDAVSKVMKNVKETQQVLGWLEVLNRACSASTRYHKRYTPLWHNNMHKRLSVAI